MSVNGGVWKSLAVRAGILKPKSEASVLVEGYNSLVTPPPRNTLGDSRALDAVYRALAILETSVRQLTLDTWRGSDLISTPSIVEKPNLNMTLGAFLAETVNSLAQRGNAYWFITRRADGTALNIEVLNPLEVEPTRLNTGAIVYAHKNKTYTGKQIQHLRLTHVPGELKGLSPLQACAGTVKGALDMRRYADEWINQPVPRGYLTSEQVLNAEQAKEAKDRANETLQAGAGIAVLGAGLKYNKLLLTPEELQFLESQAANVLSIARMFGIPARHMLSAIDGGAQTYANLEQEEITYIRYTLMAYLREIEEAFSVLVPRGQTVRFNLEGLLRTDTKTRYESYAIALDKGFYTVNEVRAIEGMQPLPEPQAEPQEQEQGQAVKEQKRSKKSSGVINVVIGAPASGKNTYIAKHASKGAVIIDQDALNIALGARHRYPNKAQAVTGFAARRGALDEILNRGVDGETWVIHTSPNSEQVKQYERAAALFHVIAPPIDEVLARANEDDRPQGTSELIQQWYKNPPQVPHDDTIKEEVNNED